MTTVKFNQFSVAYQSNQPAWFDGIAMKTITLYKRIGCKWIDKKPVSSYREVGEVQVDDSDYDYLSQWRWFMDKDGYAVRFIEDASGKTVAVLMHRVILEAKKGELGDHIDRNRKNNQRSNLRITDFRGNSLNRMPMTDEWKAAIGRGMLGHKRSPETRAKQSASLMGHAVSDETREKLRKAATGKNLSDEAKAKVSAFQKNHVLTKQRDASGRFS